MSKKKRKIAIFHQEFYFSGGAERLIFEEMAALEKAGFYVEGRAPLVARKDCFPDQINNYKIKGFFPYLPFIPRELTILLSCLLAPLLVWRFYDFDLFYGTNQAGPWFAFVAAKIFRKPYLVFMPYPVGLLYPRQIDQEVGLLTEIPFWIRMTMLVLKPLIKFLDWQVMTQANVLLTGGKYAQTLFEKIYRRKVINDPSGAEPMAKKRIDFKKRWQGKVKLGQNTVKKPYVLMTNRPMPKKKFEYLIEALPAILKNFPQTRIAIAGGINDYTRSLENLAQKLGVKKKVVFLEFLDGDDLEKAYLEAAVYVYTAPEEDYGKGMVEAMAYGVPVVAWNNAGPTGIVVDGKTGFLAKPFSIHDLAEKILILLKDKKLNQKMGQAGWREVKKNFTTKGRMEILIREIRNALKKTV